MFSAWALYLGWKSEGQSDLLITAIAKMQIVKELTITIRRNQSQIARKNLTSWK